MLQFRTHLYLFALIGLFSSCNHQAVWEETKTAGRYLNKKGLALIHQDSDSKIVRSNHDFHGPSHEEFIPIKESDAKTHLVETTHLQPKDFKVDAGGQIAALKQFKEPHHILAGIFKTVFFNTDDDVLRNKEYFLIVKKIGDYLKAHPQIDLFVAGHCDERASDTYNLALGAKRANSVRNLLIKEGISPERIYTISYGKQQPVDPAHTKSAWAKNRRVEFKIFDKTSSD